MNHNFSDKNLLMHSNGYNTTKKINVIDTSKKYYN